MILQVLTCLADGHLQFAAFKQLLPWSLERLWMLSMSLLSDG